MSATVSQRPESAVPRVAGRRGRTVTLWVLQTLLAVSFAAGGLLKLGGAHQMVELFARIGAGQWFRYLIGAFELAGAGGLLIPAVSGLAALGLTGLMTGAGITNAFVIHTSPLVPLAFLVISAVVAAGRWTQIREIATRLQR